MTTQELNPAEPLDIGCLTPALPPRYQHKRKVRLLVIEPRAIATVIAGYGYATIAYFAGITIEAVVKAASRGVFRLDDLGSVARYITAKHKKRVANRPPPPRRRQEPEQSIRARLGGRGKTKQKIDMPSGQPTEPVTSA